MEKQVKARALLKTTKLTKTYQGYQALDEVSMTINKGDIYGFIGKNGAGKTTFIRLITGLIEKSSGNLSFDGEAVSMGAVIEGPVCYPYLSAKENLEYVAIQQNMRSKSRIKDVLEFVGLKDVDPRKKYRDYSLGMKQRLGIGMAMLNNPDFLILDEPINGLDPQGIIEIRDIITRLNEEFGTTILISSHILSELSLVATRYGIIDGGKLIKELTQAQLEKACKQSLMLNTSCNERARRILQSNEIELEEVEDGLSLKVDKKEMKTIARELFQHSVYVTSFFVKEKNLEDYYIETVKGV